MKAMLLVALGGAVGSLARYKVPGWMLQHTLDWQHELFGADTRLVLFTGLLGGFATFSAFGLETMYLLRKGELLVAGSHVALSVVAGLLALWLGLGTARA
jgi:CrcB protein